MYPLIEDQMKTPQLMRMKKEAMQCVAISLAVNILVWLKRRKIKRSKVRMAQDSATLYATNVVGCMSLSALQYRDDAPRKRFASPDKAIARQCLEGGVSCVFIFILYDEKIQ